MRRPLSGEGSSPGGEWLTTVRRAPNTSISRDNRKESWRGGRLQVTGPRGVVVGGSITAPVSWHTPGGQGSVTPYLSPVSTMWWLGRSGCASTAGAQWRAVRIWMSSVHSGIGIAMADASPRCRSSRIWSRCWGHRPAPRPVGGPAHEHGACAIRAARGWLAGRSNGGAHLVKEARRARHALTGADDLDLDHARCGRSGR